MVISIPDYFWPIIACHVADCGCLDSSRGNSLTSIQLRHQRAMLSSGKLQPSLNSWSVCFDCRAEVSMIQGECTAVIESCTRFVVFPNLNLFRNETLGR